MGQEISYLVSYACPSCKTALQGRADRPDPWLRCPKCGRASQPPGPEGVLRQTPRAPARPTPEEVAAMHVIPAPPELKPMTPVAFAAPERPAPAAARVPAHHDVAVSPGVAAPIAPLSHALARTDEVSPRLDLRVVFASGFFVSVTFLLFAFLEQEPTVLSICGLLAMIFAVALMLSAR